MHPTQVQQAQSGYARPGEILLGKYRVEEVIGVGGMGCVVRASHLYLQQPVAIKILLPNMVESQSTVQRFMREAQATVKLRSEHIARVMDVSTMHDGTPVMVMEYLDGYDLNQILRHHGPQMPQAVVDLMLQACEGIAEAHALGIIHRDIKPSNFFITRRPDGSNLLKILDFGISKAAGDGLSELTGTQTVIGTPTYMAPEQMQTARSTDPRSDIWSMGVVMYQLLAGRPPFEAENYAQLVLMVAKDPPAPLTTPLPGGLLNIVLRCLEKDPKNRMQTVGELARMLAPYASDPLSAQQSAERATRILAGPRGSQPGFPLASSSGAGVQLTPPALTPKSWGNTGSSLGGAAGQMGTKVVRGGRGLVIAGVATLCVAAGAGGYVIAKSGGSDKDTHVTAPAATTTAPAEPPMPTPTPPTPPPAQTATTTPPPAPTPTVPTAPPPATAPTTPPTTTTTTPAVTTPTVKVSTTTTTKSTPTAKTTTPTTKTTSTTTKTTTKSSTTKTTTHKPKGDDLFDDRH